jgi:hypothetical protein
MTLCKLVCIKNQMLWKLLMDTVFQQILQDLLWDVWKSPVHSVYEQKFLKERYSREQ